MRKGWIAGLWLLAACAFADDTANITKVIPLQYRDASQVMALVKPLLQPGDKISGTGQTLVVNVSPDTLTNLRVLLHQIDVPPVTFDISIHQGPPQGPNDFNNNTINYTSHSQQQQLNNQSVRVMNGESAFISTSEDVPVIQSAGIGLWTGVDYARANVQNGVYLSPTLQGAQVKLVIRRTRDQQQPANQQQFSGQQTDTTVMVPLNTWYALGSAQNAQDNNNNTVVYGSGAQYEGNSTLYVMINVVKQ